MDQKDGHVAGNLEIRLGNGETKKELMKHTVVLYDVNFIWENDLRL